MESTAIVLVVLSALIHAGWNFISKRTHPTAAFFLVACVAGSLTLSPAVLLYPDAIAGGFTARVWMFLGTSGFFLALYYSALSAAYRAGDLSMVYPLAKSAPLIVVLFVSVFLGRGNQISAMCVAGIVMIVGGCVLIPLRQFNEIHWRKYLTPACGLAVLAAFGTAGYSIVDDEALRLLRHSPDIAEGGARVTLLYTCLGATSACLWLTVFVAVRPGGRADLRLVLRTKRWQALLAGALIYIAYGLVLVSLAFARNVSYIVGFRQLSIPMSVMLGVVVLKEPAYRPKLVGVTIVFIGLMLLAAG